MFRNETLDATHLAEFHQIEGVVADHGLTLGHLMGVLREFFSKLGEWPAGPGVGGGGGEGRARLGHLLGPTGITQLRFKPTYNPYTEPSMEVFSYHQGEHRGHSPPPPAPHPGTPHAGSAPCTASVPAAGLKKWVEVGNSGLFRPEMLLPMGLPENVSVIAWGLSLER